MSSNNKIQYIKDGNNAIIGQKQGNWILRNGKQIARYDEKLDQTISASGKRYGYGDQLNGALKDEININKKGKK